MGWEKTLLPRGVQVLDHLELGTPLPPYAPGLAWQSDAGAGRMLSAAKTPVKQASPNHKAEAWGVELSRTAAANDTEQFDAAKSVALDAYFPREFTAVWGSETLCPDGHGGQHLAGLMMMCVGAFLSGDAELLDKCLRLIRINAAMLLAVASPGPDYAVWSCGVRAPGRPTSSVATAWLRLLHGVHPGRAFDPKKNDKAAANWAHPQHLAIRALRYLQQKGWRAGGPYDAGEIEPKVPRLRWPVRVYRWKTGHLAVMPMQEQSPQSEVCNWVWCGYPVSKNSIQFGHNWEKPVPDAPAGSLMLEYSEDRP